MQNVIVDQWEAFNQASLKLTKSLEDTSKSVFDQWFKEAWSPDTWTKLVKSSVETSKAVTDIGTDYLNKSLQSKLRKDGLDAVATSTQELGGILSEFATSLAQTQVSAFNSVIGAYTNSLGALKKATTADDLVTAQLQLQTEIQEKAKSCFTETTQAMTTLKNALSTWGETSLEKFGSEKAASPKAIAIEKPAVKPARAD